MAKMRIPLAICLALALMFGSFCVCRADGPGGNSTTSGPTDGGDGHPWDDGVVEDTPPDGGDNPLQLKDGVLDPAILLPVQRGFTGLIEKTILTIWHKVSNPRINQRHPVQKNVSTIDTRRAK